MQYCNIMHAFSGPTDRFSSIVFREHKTKHQMCFVGLGCAPKTQLFTQRLFTKTALPARETCILMHIGRRIDCRKVLCEKPRSAEAAFGCRAGLKWLQKARMLCCTRGSLCHFQFRTSGRPCGAQDMLLLINLSICVLCVLCALCALLQIT